MKKHCFLFIFLFPWLISCTNYREPAPVVSLSTKVATKQNLTEISGSSYKVQAGDTLFAIAFYSGNDYKDLARINKLAPPYTIHVGQTLNLIDDTTNHISSKNTDNQRTAQNLNKKSVDHQQTQAYGGESPVNHRKNQNNKSKTSIKPYNNLTWMWPADGTSTIATVGSDGSKRGLDIKGRFGSSVKAAASGKVVYAGNALKGYGNLIIIKHNNEYLSAYAHNSSIIVGEQSYVKQGQKIATMGNSGASEVMLHFEIRKKGKSVDPFKYLPPI